MTTLSPSKMRRLGICEWYLPAFGTEAIRFAANAGYDGIQIFDAGGALEDARTQRDYLQAAAEHGVSLQALTMTSLISGGGLCADAGSAARDEFLEGINRGIAVCRAMGIPDLLLIGMEESRPETEIELENTCQVLREVICRAASHGIRVLYESFLPMDQTIRLLDAAADLLLLYDLINPIRRGFDDPAKELCALAEAGKIHLIGAVHVKDLPPSLAGTVPFGAGCGHIEDSLRLLLDLGYHGWLVSENFYAEDCMTAYGSPAETAADDLRWLKRRYR